jgi:glycerophosphoryl diester phosphodiesterase
MRLIAHRGAPQKFQENTLASFEAALNNGAQYIELDVHITQDNHLIV